jgi:hypothetical protein
MYGDLAQDRDHCRAFMNTVMNLSVPHEAEEFLLTGWATQLLKKTAAWR